MTAAAFDRRAALRALGAAALVASGGVSAAEPGLAGVKARGALTVALYRDMPPFHDKGRASTSTSPARSRTRWASSSR